LTEEGGGGKQILGSGGETAALRVPLRSSLDDAFPLHRAALLGVKKASVQEAFLGEGLRLWAASRKS